MRIESGTLSESFCDRWRGIGDIMHVVFVTTNFVENNGPTMGLPKYLFRVSRALINYGHKISVVTCSNRTVEYEFYGINVYRVRREPFVLSHDQKIDAIAEGLRDGYLLSKCLEKIYQREKIDVVQYTSINGLSIYHSIPVPAILRLSSYAKMVKIDGMEQDRIGKSLLEREASRKCVAIFAPSYETARCFAVDIARHVDVIESPYVPDDCKMNETLYIKKFEGKKYILFYGTLIKCKGLGVIADMSYSILEQNKDLHIGIIGSGDKQLVDLIVEKAGKFADRIIYNESVGLSELSPVILNAEAIMFPSLTENLSNACIETMAMGQIAVGTRGASFEQLITDGVNGFLCEIGDAKSLEYAINKALKLTDDQKRKMKTKAKERIELLKPDRVVKQLINYYDNAITNYNKERQENAEY